MELIQYIPSDMDFQNTDEKDIQDYLAKSKAAVADETGFDPSLITMGWEDNDLTITFTCQTLEQLQKIHDFYYDDTVSFIYKTAYDMEGTTACDGQPVKRPKADIKDFDKDMNTIQEWNPANAANIESFWDGTMDPDSSTNFTNSMDEIGNLIRKWKYNTDLLDDQQKQTFEEVKKAHSYALTGS